MAISERRNLQALKLSWCTPEFLLKAAESPAKVSECVGSDNMRCHRFRCRLGRPSRLQGGLHGCTNQHSMPFSEKLVTSKHFNRLRPATNNTAWKSRNEWNILIVDRSMSSSSIAAITRNLACQCPLCLRMRAHLWYQFISAWQMHNHSLLFIHIQEYIDPHEIVIVGRAELLISTCLESQANCS